LQDQKFGYRERHGLVLPGAGVALRIHVLIVVISIKYALLILRADNHGEGGILALLALISPRHVVVIGLIGACLLYGDGAITPAISVLSAIEGIKVYAPHLDHAVVPLTVVILVFLFLIQSKGTSWIGGLFGPVMLVWFIVIGLLGIVGIARSPTVLRRLWVRRGCWCPRRRRCYRVWACGLRRTLLGGGVHRHFVKIRIACWRQFHAMRVQAKRHAQYAVLITAYCPLKF
jgi:hypothetical protein